MATLIDMTRNQIGPYRPSIPELILDDPSSNLDPDIVLAANDIFALMDILEDSGIERKNIKLMNTNDLIFQARVLHKKGDLVMPEPEEPEPDGTAGRPAAFSAPGNDGEQEPFEFGGSGEEVA